MQTSVVIIMLKGNVHLNNSQSDKIYFNDEMFVIFVCSLSIFLVHISRGCNYRLYALRMNTLKPM